MYPTPSAAHNSAHDTLTKYLTSRRLELSTEQVAKLLNFCALILRWNRLTSLVQANSLDQLVESHVIDCLAALDEISGPNIVDVGSGAGFPGIVFAIAKPQWQFYLIEPNERRARFLTQAQIDQSLTNVVVVNSRVEDWQGVESIDCITSRAFSALADFFANCRHLSAPEANAFPRFVALKGRVEKQELAELVAAGVPPEAITAKPLIVPGREHRHAVLIEPVNPRVLVSR